LPGRSVTGYHSQIVSNPERAFEIFVLEPPIRWLPHGHAHHQQGHRKGNYVWLIFVLVVV
jgi:hypothetical protein